MAFLVAVGTSFRRRVGVTGVVVGDGVRVSVREAVSVGVREGVFVGDGTVFVGVGKVLVDVLVGTVLVGVNVRES